MWRHTENNYLLGCVLKNVLLSSVKRLRIKAFHIQKTLNDSHLGEITLGEIGSKCAKNVHIITKHTVQRPKITDLI